MFGIAKPLVFYHLLANSFPVLLVVKDTSYLTERHEIKKHVLGGEIRAAVSKLSDVNSALMRDIGFHLHVQALLEIIRKGNNMEESLKYAQVVVAPLAKDNAEFVQELESVMALLIYADASQSPDAHFLSPEQRERTADIANAALLKYAKFSDKPKLDRIMKAVNWAQRTAIEAGIKAPRLIDLRTLEFDESVDMMDEDQQPLLQPEDALETEYDDDDDEEDDEEEEEDDENDEEDLAEYEDDNEDEEVFAPMEEEQE